MSMESELRTLRQQYANRTNSINNNNNGQEDAVNQDNNNDNGVTVNGHKTEVEEEEGEIVKEDSTTEEN